MASVHCCSASGEGSFCNDLLGATFWVLFIATCYSFAGEGVLDSIDSITLSILWCF